MATENEATEKPTIPDYYYTIIEKGIDAEKTAKKFDRLCTEYETLHTVKWKSFGFAYANTSFVYVMTFCCDGDDAPYIGI